MVRTALLVVEMLVIVVALGGGTVAIMRGRDTLAGGKGQAVAKRQVLVDVVLADVVVGVMVVAAWAVYVEKSWGGWMSIVAGGVLVAVLAIRPGLAVRQSVASGVALLGVLVAVLGFLLPGGS